MSHSVDEPVSIGAGWYAVILGVVIVLIGVVLALGGVWLIVLGGSWYYAITGFFLILSGSLLTLRRSSGVWLFVLIWLGTLIWALWEVTLDGWQTAADGWALVPRVVAPTVILLLALIALAVTGPRARRGAATVATVVLGLIVAMCTTTDLAAQVTEPAEPEETTESALNIIDETEEERPAPETLLEPGKDWPVYGGSLEGKQFSPLAQINAQNVDQLEQVWSFATGDLPAEGSDAGYSPENTPLMIDRTLYICSPMNQIIAVEASSGKEKWRYDPEVSTDAIPYGATCRGLAYHRQEEGDPAALCAERILMATLDARLIAVDAGTGQLCPDFGEAGLIDLEEGLGKTVPGWYAVTAPPTVVRGVAVVGAQVSDNEENDAPSGVLRGYDVVSGEFLWAWDMGRVIEEVPGEGEHYTRGTPNMWTAAAGDQELGYIYAPLGNSSGDYLGSDRSDLENKFASALVAIDVTTGDDVWHFQTVHHDVWDYDLGSQVSLVDFPQEGGSVPALILPSKQGQIYILNRETGESLFPVEEREVTSIGSVEPEYLSDTQPYSGYADLSKPNLTERDMWGMSPIDQLYCRIQFHRANYDGQYTPPSVDKPFIQYPGYNGGSDWGNVSVDMERGIIVANYNDMPNFNQLIPRSEADERGISSFNPENGDVGAMGGLPYSIDVNAGWRVPYTGMLCKQPPYGWIRGIDLVSGETLWDKPFGSAENNGPFGIPSMLPITIGTPNNGGPVSTAGGVTFIAATTDDKFRAFATETGEILWESDLPGGGQTIPITYEVDGRQYVVIYPGGHHFMETEVSDQVIAYALPAG